MECPINRPLLLLDVEVVDVVDDTVDTASSLPPPTRSSFADASRWPRSMSSDRFRHLLDASDVDVVAIVSGPIPRGDVRTWRDATGIAAFTIASTEFVWRCCRRCGSFRAHRRPGLASHVDDGRDARGRETSGRSLWRNDFTGSWIRGSRPTCARCTRGSRWRGSRDTATALSPESR